MIRIKLSRILGDMRIPQAELSRRTGIGTNSICHYYNEVTDRINLEHLDRICEALDCDITDIFMNQIKLKKQEKILLWNSMATEKHRLNDD